MHVALLSSSKGSLDTFGALKFAAPRMASMGILHIASNMEKHGYDQIDIYDADLMWKKDSSEILDWVHKVNPDVLGITLYSNHIVTSKELLSSLKASHPNMVIIAGGPHCTVDYKLTLSYLPVDYVCVGEGEHTMVEFLDHLSGKCDLETVKGLAYHRNDEIVFNGARELEEDLDIFPPPAYHLIRNYIPLIRPQVLGYKKTPLVMLISSRGCPYHCGFCSDSIIWTRNNRAHSPEYMVKMVKYLKNEFGIKEITFFDDTFILNKKRILKFCDLLIEGNINILWSANINIAHVTEEVAERMKKAGCWYVSVGIESGSDEILKFLKKPQTVEIIRKGVHILYNCNILVRGYFVLGLLKETPETIEQTINLILELPLYSIQVSIYVVNIGSPWYDIGEQYGAVNQQYASKFLWMGSSADELSFVANGLTSELLIRKSREVNLRFYFRLSQIWFFINSITTVDDIKRTFRFIFAGVYYLYTTRTK